MPCFDRNRPISQDSYRSNMTPKQVATGIPNYGRLLFLSLAAALLLMAGPECQAAGPRFDVFPGYGNNFLVPDQGWFPITCELQNDGPAFNAIIEVSAAQMGRGKPAASRWTCPPAPSNASSSPSSPPPNPGTSACWMSAAESGPNNQPDVQSHSQRTAPGRGAVPHGAGLPSFPEFAKSARLQSSSLWRGPPARRKPSRTIRWPWRALTCCISIRPRRWT